jgi:hypothetical protein
MEVSQNERPSCSCASRSLSLSNCLSRGTKHLSRGLIFETACRSPVENEVDSSLELASDWPDAEDAHGRGMKFVNVESRVANGEDMKEKVGETD